MVRNLSRFLTTRHNDPADNIQLHTGPDGPKQRGRCQNPHGNIAALLGLRSGVIVADNANTGPHILATEAMAKKTPVASAGD